ncbi:MAG: thioesterase family protein [Cyanobacteria bacterium P01_F01_bin.4]
MSFEYPRTIRFHETDAAGVVYFANLLTLCHETYEASLASTGIDLHQFFGGASTAVPVVHAEIDFRRPLHCGDRVLIMMVPRQVDETSFEVEFRLLCIVNPVNTLAIAMTRHVCIVPETQQRQSLTPELTNWLEIYGAGVNAESVDGVSVNARSAQEA